MNAQVNIYITDINKYYTLNLYNKFYTQGFYNEKSFYSKDQMSILNLTLLMLDKSIFCFTKKTQFTLVLLTFSQNITLKTE